MFSFAGSHSDTGSGSATEDEIVRDTSRALGQIMTAARTWIHTHRGRRGAEGVPKLSRKERRDLAESIRVQVGEQKIAAAWYTKRVNDFHAEVVAAGVRREQPGFSSADAAIDQARLAGIRYSIESTLHETQALPLERRGQVAMALVEADRNPDRPYGAIFKPMDREQERVARSVAVQSETWVAGRRDDNARLVAEQRAQAAKRAEKRREARPPLAWEDMNPEQQDAVQQLRGAELALRAVGTTDPVKTAGVDREMRAAAREVRAAGLPLRQVAHERDNIVANSKFEVVVHAGESASVSWHPSETTALVHAGSAVARVPDTTESMNVYVAPRYGQDPGGNVRSVHGDHMFTSQAVSWWQGDHEIAMESGTARAGHRTEISIAGTDPVTGREVRRENVIVRTDELGALEYADRTIECAEWRAGETVELDIDDAEVDWEYPGSTSLYRMSGSPASVQNGVLNEQVTVQHQAVQESRAAAARVAADHDSLRQRHSLSIEHNADLTDRNGQLTRQLAALIAERDQALADRDKFRGERDEAVQKVVSMTPPEKRFGSPERQAAQARATATKSTQERAGAPVNAFSNASASVNAFSVETEREGMER